MRLLTILLICIALCPSIAKVFTLQEYGQMLQIVEDAAKKSIKSKNYKFLFQELERIPEKITLIYAANNDTMKKEIHLSWLKTYLHAYIDTLKNENGSSIQEILENAKESNEEPWSIESRIVPIEDKIKSLILTLQSAQKELSMMGYKYENESKIKTNLNSLTDNSQQDNTRKNSSNWLHKAFEKISTWIQDNFKGIQKIWNGFLMLLILVAIIFLGIQAIKQIRNSESPAQETTHAGLLHPDDPRSSRELIQKAKEHQDKGDLRTAIRYYYIAFIVELEERNILPYQPHFTNWEYQRKLNSMGYTQKEIQELTAIFDKVWYGMYPVQSEEYQKYILNYEKIKNILTSSKA
ncbi:MAG: DUF4129 domain-containing protein [Bacteroidia bacterium]|nr:DUF4129 domain-containing protein [Bacteroidia bacterium]